VLKCPLDLWIYQEILYELRPELIVEAGTYLGGTTLFLASICDLLGRGEVLTIDTDRRSQRPRHRRVT
jgi:cephalosporin hydroxylase